MKQSTDRRTHKPASILGSIFAIGIGIAGWILPQSGFADPQTSLAGEKAIDHLKASGQYESLSQAMTAARYGVRNIDGEPGEARAENPQQGLDARFDANGLRLSVRTPEDKTFTSRWQLESFGYGDDRKPVPAGEVRRDGQRAEIVREGFGLTEWFVNTPAGLEHGFTLSDRPAHPVDSKRPLTLAVTISGDLEARAIRDGQAVQLRDASRGTTVLTYDKLKVWDAEGRFLEARIRTADDPRTVIYEVDDAAARYPLTIDPTFVNESAKLLASDAAAGDRLGFRVAVSGDTVVVSALLEDAGATDSGSVYVFTRPASGWAGPLTEAAKLIASDGAANDWFGIGVAVSGDTVVVGARLDDDNGINSGSAYVFVKPAGGWAGTITESAKLLASDGEANDWFSKPAISGDVVAVGAKHDGDNGFHSGSIYLFEKPAGGWTGNLTESAKLLASDGAANDLIGESVGISGDTVVTGAKNDDDNDPNSGSAYVFVKPAGGWAGILTETAKLLASDGVFNDRLGVTVDVSGDTVVTGALFDDDKGTDSGSAYVFVKPSGGWAGIVTESAKLLASDGAEFDHLGERVGVSDNGVVLGAPSDDDNGPDSGSAYVFAKPVGGWSGTLTESAKLLASDGAAGDRFSWGVAASGFTVVVGADLDDDNDTSSGSAYVFSFDIDGDGLSDVEEISGSLNPWTAGVLGTPPGDPTDPNDADSDDDTLNDGDEVLVHGTDPNNGDSDDDGLGDGEEVNTYGTDPGSADTDGDGIDDGTEIAIGTDPLTPDVIGDVIEQLTRDLADAVCDLDVSALDAPNAKAAKGRRGALCNKIRAAANKAAAGNLAGAREKLTGDVTNKANDWLKDPAKSEVLAEIAVIVALIDAALAP